MNTIPTEKQLREQGFAPFRKKTITWARQMTEAFTVDTLEGVMQGKAGDWLAVGIKGEMYPIDAAIFEQTYDAAE